MSEPEHPSEKTRRTSITKLQRQTAAGAELIALCQTVTEDGALSDDEVAALRQWLADHADSDLPARSFLFQTVERILADGKVTAGERLELYDAIEKVLPPDIRDSVRGKRAAVERAATDEARHAKEEAAFLQRVTRARNAPVDTWDFMVAGVRHEGRDQVIQRFAEPGDVAYLIRDRENRFSRHAVEVRLSNGMQAGFVPEEFAVEIASLLDSDYRHDAYIKKVLTGGRSPIPVIVASLYSFECDNPGAFREDEVPAAQKPLLFERTPSSPRTAKPGCLGLLILAVCALASLAAFR